jgi:hypothetical protein
MTACNSRSSARLKAFRAMTFSAADHFKSWIAVPAPKGARLGTLVNIPVLQCGILPPALAAEKAGFP